MTLDLLIDTRSGMRPFLFDHIAAYPVCLWLGVVVAVFMGTWELRRTGISICVCLQLQMILTAAGLIGARLQSLFQDGGSLTPFSGGLVQGYRYPGGIAAVAAVLIICGPRLTSGISIGRVADALAPSVGIGMAVARLGCFSYGCCYGSVSVLPWAVRFPAHSPAWQAHILAGLVSPQSSVSLPVHPLQLYLLVLALAGTAIAYGLRRYRQFPGQIALVFVCIDQVGKFGLEFLRDHRSVSLQMSSLLIASIATAAALILSLRWRARISEHTAISR